MKNSVREMKFSSLFFIVRDRNLIASLVRREFVGKYAGTYLGLLWTILQPLLFVALYTLVFSIIMRGKTAGDYSDIPFPVWLMAGMLPWTMFSESLSRSATSITDNVNMVKKTLFDKRVLPLSSVLSGVISHLVSLLVLSVLMLIFGVPFHETLYLLPLIILLTTFFTVSWAYILSAFNAFFRDINHALGTILQFAFFATPIVYPQELVPESLRILILINPMHHLISFYRQVLLSGTTPDVLALAATTLGTGLLFVFADSLFRKLSPEFGDVL